MDGAGPHHPLSDSQLDRDLESALGIEPSPEFIARVRTRMAADEERSPWQSRLGFAVRRTAFEPLVALGVVGVLLVVVIPNVMRKDVGQSNPHVANPAAVEFGRAQEAEAGPSPERPVIASPVRARARAMSGREVPLRLSKPLFAPKDRDALVALVTAMEGGRVVPLPSVSQADERSLDLHELSIAPLVLDPLPQLAELGAL